LKTLILYSTVGCHLCEQAKALLLHCLDQNEYRVEEVDIADDDALMERYGVTIPVVAKAGGEKDGEQKQELNWPFDAEQLQAWLKT